MTDQTEQIFEIPVFKTQVRHTALGYDIELFVPARAAHRPAVSKSLGGEYYEAFSHQSFKKILDFKGNKSALHAGAFFGDMLHTYAQSAGMVYAFEPVLENYFIAKKNVESLGLDNVFLVNAALSDKCGIARIETHDTEGRFKGGGSSLNESAIGTSELVSKMRIDDLPTEDLCLIQLDVEGHELEALKGAIDTINWFRPIILVEDNRLSCTRLLRDLGYRRAFKKGGLGYWGTGGDHKFLLTLE